MTRKELSSLNIGTLLYNGHVEGMIKMEGKEKVIEISIPICDMHNDATDFNARPEHWVVLEN